MILKRFCTPVYMYFLKLLVLSLLSAFCIANITNTLIPLNTGSWIYIPGIVMIASLFLLPIVGCILLVRSVHISKYFKVTAIVLLVSFFVFYLKVSPYGISPRWLRLIIDMLFACSFYAVYLLTLNHLLLRLVRTLALPVQVTLLVAVWVFMAILIASGVLSA